VTHVLVESEPTLDWRAAARQSARRLATITVVGAVAGVFVVGVLSRLAMMLLAVLNPGATGVTSDDGFTMGQFTLSGSAQLALAGLQFGVTGAFCYVVVRGLLVGPAWFRLVSVSLGPAVVIGAIVVHTDGVDFPLLEPSWLAVALFVAVPWAYVALLHVFAERALRRGGYSSTPALVLGLAPWVLLLPLGLILVGGWLALRALRRTGPGHRLLTSPWPAWVLRVGLAALFVMALLDLRSDLMVLG
jgi:hypothetical protein